MPVAVVGAGITGSVLARCLAEKGQHVHVYEASNRYGGLAYAGRYTCKLRTDVVKLFLLHRCALHEIAEGMYTPAESWHLACQTLLQHENISTLFSAPITHPHLLHENYPMSYSTVRADRLYECDLQEAGVLPNVARWTLLRYKRAAQEHHITLVGMQEMYQVLTIEEAVQQVLQLAQHL